MFAKFKKCEFWIDCITCLGHLISKEEISVNLNKMEVIMNWPIPTNVGEVRNFLGLVGYYWQFVEGFSKIVLPLTHLVRKNVRSHWSNDCDKSFNELKQQLITTLTLTTPSKSS